MVKYLKEHTDLAQEIEAKIRAELLLPKTKKEDEPEAKAEA